ncbi:hypothetical protein PDESU_00722 [Pontiella desulfatans]|uniref:Methyltransferase type 11 domain-containing protein n=1 Tax=Pontiella desulfatans TaxID=2750659 RepID=A0A6C2TXV7_PONDE|nr:hypothetical protein PDESU_00722 [Pontiella desulfatans]
MRKRRMRFLDDVISASNGKPLSIADLGGTLSFWEMNLEHLAEEGRIGKIDVFNLESSSGRVLRIGDVEIREFNADVTDLLEIGKTEYDIAFSNSVIEHVGNLHSQSLFAKEIRRISRRYIMQTPNRRFPIEPHFYVPFFPYIPLGIRSWLHQRFKLGWLMAESDPLQARIDCDQIRLLTRRELELLFDDAQIHVEWICGFAKSYILVGETTA